MMFRLVHRLKKKHGAVLFAVIAVMALLIAMATAAYYTARGSYNTVVSNYDFSQMYISAISAADMIKGAVMNSASTTGAEATLPDGTSMNYFDKLKEGIKNLKVGQSIYLKSDNISDVTEDHDKIAEALKKLPNEQLMAPGSLDGAIIKITLLKEYPRGFDPNPVTPAPVAGKDTFKGQYDDVFEIVTTVFYRGNSIQVDDIISSTIWKLYDVAPGSDTYLVPVEKSSTEIEVIEIKKPGGGNMFNTFFTATAQHLNNTTGAVEEYQMRCVVIDCKTITDDAYFKSDRVFVKDQLGNVIEGGITTSGSIYFNELKYRPADATNDTAVSGSAEEAANSRLAKAGDNDWFIGNHLVLAKNAANINLGTGDKASSLYVGGDLVLCASGTKITAKDIYVGGNLIILRGTQDINLDANVHLIGDTNDGKGNIYFSVDGTDAFTSSGMENDISYYYEHNNDGESGNVVTKALYTNGKVLGTKKGKVNGVELAVGSNLSSGGNVSKLDDDPDAVTYKTTINRNDKFDRDYPLKDDKGNAIPVTGATAMTNNQTTLASTTYGVMTSPQATYDNLLTINLNTAGLEEVKVGGTFKGYKGTFDVVGPSGTVAQAFFTCNSDGKEATLSLPYVEDGYVLELQNLVNEWKELTPGNWGNTNGALNSNASDFSIEIESVKGKSMPIVLAPNCKSSDGKDAFSWNGSKDFNNMYTNVKVMPETEGDTDYGNVSFEMANMVSGSSAKYEPFDASKVSSTTVTKYITNEKVMVGTKHQIELIRGGKDSCALDFPKADEELNGAVNEMKIMFQTKNKMLTSDPNEGYGNHVMLISNANSNASAGTAIDFTKQDSSLFGYIYAPNAFLDAGLASGDAESIIGGIIVSSYNANNNYFTFVEPKPSDIESMTSVMDGSGASGGAGSVEQIKNEIKKKWTEYEEHGTKSNKTVSDLRLSDDDPVWVEVGSNYVG